MILSCVIKSLSFAVSCAWGLSRTKRPHPIFIFQFPAVGPQSVARMHPGGARYSNWLDMLRFISRAIDGKESGECEIMTVAGTSLVISGVSLDVMTYPDTWKNGGQKGVRQDGSVGVFSFPKYSKASHSSEKKQLERLKSTTAYAFLQGENRDMMLLACTCASEEVHRLIDQWEVGFDVILHI